MQTSYWYSSYSRLSISTPVVTSQIKVIYVFSLSYPHSYQSIPLLSETPGNNSVLLKYATTHTTVDQGTAHELRPRLFPTFVVNFLPLRSNSAPFRVTLLPLRTSLTPLQLPPIGQSLENQQSQAHSPMTLLPRIATQLRKEASCRKVQKDVHH